MYFGVYNDRFGWLQAESDAREKDKHLSEALERMGQYEAVSGGSTRQYEAVRSSTRR